MKLVVLDDDPTGTQTVHGIPVLTEWSESSLRAEFDSESPAFFILTNTRAMDPAEAEKVNTEIAKSLKSAANGNPFTVASRSDSTLRGHFPLETDVLNRELGPFDGILLIPYFEAGGRLTIGDVHYVREDDQLIPAAETPFAKDAAFGFKSSNLRDYVEEKTGGRISRDDVVSIPAGISAGEINGILMNLTDSAHCVVNVASPEELAVFRDGLALAEAAGKRFLFRSAAELVRAWLRQEPSGLLDRETLGIGTGAGLVVAGSYVPKTTAQLVALGESGFVEVVELEVPALLSDARDGEIRRTCDAMNRLLAAGCDTLVMTSRKLVSSADPGESLRIGNAVSTALVEIVSCLQNPPAWIIAKGGITSSDVATDSLNIRRSMVMGQLLPGVPVWKTGSESRFPGIPYIVFPGNVGGAESLVEAVSRCRGE